MPVHKTSAGRVRAMIRGLRKASMAVTVIRPPIASDPAAEVPHTSWGDLLAERYRFCTQYLPKDCRNLLFFVEDGASNEWLGLGTRERYIREGLGLDPETVGWALTGLRQMRPHEPIGFDEAVVLGKHGGDRRSAAVRDQGGNATLKAKEKNTVKHLLARLDRDRPDLAARVRANETSAHAAAIEAGFRRQTIAIDADDRRAAATILRRWGAGRARGFGQLLLETAAGTSAEIDNTGTDLEPAAHLAAEVRGRTDTTVGLGFAASVGQAPKLSNELQSEKREDDNGQDAGYGPEASSQRIAKSTDLKYYPDRNPYHEQEPLWIRGALHLEARLADAVAKRNK